MVIKGVAIHAGCGQKRIVNYQMKGLRLMFCLKAELSQNLFCLKNSIVTKVDFATGREIC